MLMIRIFEWDVVPETCTLHRIETEEESHLCPRGMEVLVYLTENRGKVISSHELLEKFWTKSVNSDHAVHNAIAEIRAALGDSASKPRYIKTFPKRGYALIAEATSPQTESPKSNFAPKFGRWIAAAAANTSNVRLISAGLLLGGIIGISAMLLDRDFTSSITPASATSLVVIPFEKINIAEENRYWVDQFAEHFPSVIARIPDIQIKKGFNAPNVAEFINQKPQLVEYVLSGSIMQANEQLRLSLELINTEDGTVRFSDQFNLGSEAIFSVQDEITSRVVAALSIYLNESQRSEMLDWGTKNANAYKHFLQAEFHALQLNAFDLDLAIENYCLAVKEDPDFLNAYLGLANSAARKGLISHNDDVAELAVLVNSALREVIRLRADKESLLTTQILALRIEGTNQKLIEQQLRELILSGDAPDFAYAHYATYLTGVRMYDEAQQFLQFVHNKDSYVISPDASWNYHSRVATPLDLVSIKKQQLLERPSHISVMTSLIRSAAFVGDFGLANSFLRRQLQLDNDGPYSMLDQVTISALAGSSIEEGDRLESEKLDNPDYNFSHGAKRFILGDIEGGIALWKNLNAAETRRLYNFIDNTEIFFPPSVTQDSRYQNLLDEIGVGISWQRHLMESVMEMSSITGVELNEKSRAAYESNTFMSRNNLWDHNAITYPHRTPVDTNRVSAN